MSGRYPSDGELASIRTWEFKDTQTYIDFAKYVVSIWEYADIGYAKIYGRSLSLHTGGWSGNEDIYSALQETMFWTVCWKESKRGGHYKFRIPKL